MGPAPLFPRRGPSGRFPHFTGRIEELRLLSSRPGPASVVPRRPVLPPRSFPSLRPAASALPAAWGCFTGVPFASSEAEALRPPRFLGDPCPHAVLSDPGRASVSRLVDPSVLPALNGTALAPTTVILSRLNHTACGRAVYASRPTSPPSTQDSLPAAG